jgi:hypothetical protein
MTLWQLAVEPKLHGVAVNKLFGARPLERNSGYER